MMPAVPPISAVSPSLAASPDGPVRTLSLDVDGLAIHGLRRAALDGGERAPRLLCLHGWLDNAASFLPLMPHLPAADIVAIDLPGHGLSDHLPHAAATGYTLFETALLVRRVLDALGWTSCTLVGHSMGGCIAPVLAVAAPGTVERLVLIEASGPLTEEARSLPQRLQRAFDDRLSNGRFASRTFDAPEAAVQARLKAARMEPASARLIVERQLVGVEPGWRWRFDPALRFASAQYQTEAQVQALLAAIEVPVLTVIADDGFLSKRPDTKTRFACLDEHRSVMLPGHHHVHMDTPEPVAQAMRGFIEASA